MSNSNKMASALKFNPDEDVAPQMIAKGLGYVADHIIETAKKNDVPIYVDEKLTTQLQNLEIGQTIPYDLYEVVAEVLVFISKIDQKAK